MFVNKEIKCTSDDNSIMKQCSQIETLIPDVAAI